MTPQQESTSRRILAHHSKSFALAGRLLPAWCRRDAAALYAWCRRCDDAVDGPQQSPERTAAVSRLRRELDLVHAGAVQTDPVLGAFQDVVVRHAIPRRYADDLIDGMAMDVGVVCYRTFDDLLFYCYRAAGTVGLMMAHVMNARGATALRRAADLGIAMQLTNICRDVVEDERRGRVYLPRELLGTVAVAAATAMPSAGPARAAVAVAAVLHRAEAFYRSGNAGLTQLPLRCAVAIRAAALIYAEIGRVIAKTRFNIMAGRAVVSRRTKCWLLLRAALGTAARFGWRRLTRARHVDGAIPFIALPFDLPIGVDGAGTRGQPVTSARVTSPLFPNAPECATSAPTGALGTPS